MLSLSLPLSVSLPRAAVHGLRRVETSALGGAAAAFVRARYERTPCIQCAAAFSSAAATSAAAAASAASSVAAVPAAASVASTLSSTAAPSSSPSSSSTASTESLSDRALNRVLHNASRQLLDRPDLACMPDDPLRKRAQQLLCEVRSRLERGSFILRRDHWGRIFFAIQNAQLYQQAPSIWRCMQQCIAQQSAAPQPPTPAETFPALLCRLIISSLSHTRAEDVGRGQSHGAQLAGEALLWMLAGPHAHRFSVDTASFAPLLQASDTGRPSAARAALRSLLNSARRLSSSALLDFLLACVSRGETAQVEQLLDQIKQLDLRLPDGKQVCWQINACAEQLARTTDAAVRDAALTRGEQLWRLSLALPAYLLQPRVCGAMLKLYHAAGLDVSKQTQALEAAIAAEARLAADWSEKLQQRQESSSSAPDAAVVAEKSNTAEAHAPPFFVFVDSNAVAALLRTMNERADAQSFVELADEWWQRALARSVDATPRMAATERSAAATGTVASVELSGQPAPLRLLAPSEALVAAYLSFLVLTRQPDKLLRVWEDDRIVAARASSHAVSLALLNFCSQQLQSLMSAPGALRGDWSRLQPAAAYWQSLARKLVSEWRATHSGRSLSLQQYSAWLNCQEHTGDWAAAREIIDQMRHDAQAEAEAEAGAQPMPVQSDLRMRLRPDSLFACRVLQVSLVRASRDMQPDPPLRPLIDELSRMAGQSHPLQLGADGYSRLIKTAVYADGSFLLPTILRMAMQEGVSESQLDSTAKTLLEHCRRAGIE